MKTKTMRNVTAENKPSSKAKPAVDGGLPRRYLRVVLQLEDTPVNRIIAENAVKAVKLTFHGPEGFGAIMKYEQIFMCSAEIPVTKKA